MKRLTTYILSLLFACHLAAQTTEGTEFWVTFMDNSAIPEGGSEVTLSLIVSTRYDANITVLNPQTGWQTTLSVTANGVAEIPIPHTQAYSCYEDEVDNKGLYITSDAPVSMFASNFRELSYDATIILPISGLGTDYIIQTYEGFAYAANDLYYPREFVVVATENNTRVTIIPHARTTGGHGKNVPFTVKLDRGETYFLSSSDASNDLSGTQVKADKKVAVFSGHSCTFIPADIKACDHIVEQQVPVLMWGKQFAVTRSVDQDGSRVMLTAGTDGTVITLNGSMLTTLNALESVEFRLEDNSCYVEASEPVACYLYLEGCGTTASGLGDPSSVHISPIEQQVDKLTFATFQTSVTNNHYINLVTTAAGAAAMRLDGVSIASRFSVLTGNSGLRYAQINITNGTHTIETTADGFVGYVYGIGKAESYAYNIGSATKPLDGQILVDGEPRIDIEYTDVRCYLKTVSFAPMVDAPYTSIEWVFGDGTTSTATSPTHTYAAAGHYAVEMRTVYADRYDTARTSLTLVENLYDTMRVNICKGEKFEYEDKTYTETGTYDLHYTSADGCDSILTIILNAADTFLTQQTASFHVGASYRWHNRWYREAGVYRDTLPTVNGCDSIFVLTLTTTDPTTVMADTICYQPTYTFHGHTFTLPSMEGFEDKEYINYTLEVRDKAECVTYRMNLAIIPKTAGTTETYVTIYDGQTYDFYGETLRKEGTYTKTVELACDCEQTFILHLTVADHPVDTTTVSLCHEDSYTFHDKTYTEAGSYRDTVWNVMGIEAIYQLDLSDHRTRYEMTVSGVTSYFFKGQTLTESGTYQDTLTNAAGCDSIVTLYLGINEPCTIHTEETLYRCAGETVPWNGQTCTPGNTYTAPFTTAAGCDSIATLHLLMLANTTASIDVEICEGDYYRVGDERLTGEGTHTVHLTNTNGCDSTVNVTISFKDSYDIPIEHTITEGEEYDWEGDTYSKEGYYSKCFVATNGCDSIRTLHLIVNPIPDVMLYDTWSKTAYDELFETYRGKNINVIFCRTFAVNQWTTLCLPFPLETLEDTPFDGIVYQLDDATVDDMHGLILTFSPTDAIETCMPYVVIPEVEIKNPRFEKTRFVSFEALTQSSPSGDVDFRALTAVDRLTRKTSIYLLNNRLYYANQNTGTRIRAFRAYLEFLHPDQITYVQPRICIGNTISTPPLIEGGEQDEALEDTGTYKYMENGILYIRRNGQRYNATGQAY